MLGMGTAMGQDRASLLISDFEIGLGGWVTNDAIKHSGKTKDTPLVSATLSDEAHTGAHSLEVTFHPGQGWAGAYVPVAEAGERSIRAFVGLPVVEVGSQPRNVRFPFLRLDRDTVICDAEGVAAVLR